MFHPSQPLFLTFVAPLSTWRLALEMQAQTACVFMYRWCSNCLISSKSQMDGQFFVQFYHINFNVFTVTFNVRFCCCTTSWSSSWHSYFGFGRSRIRISARTRPHIDSSQPLPTCLEQHLNTKDHFLPHTSTLHFTLSSFHTTLEQNQCFHHASCVKT